MTLYVTTPWTRRMAQRRMAQRMWESEMESERPEVIFPVRVKAEDDAYVLTALLPGVGPDDLNVQIINETVTLQGELKLAREEDANYLLSEIPSGRFYRTLTLPEPLDAAKAEASLENGVLTLRVPKAEQARPKVIKVNAR